MEKTSKRRLAAVMFTDIEGYTALVSQDEAQALQFVKQHRDSLIKHTKSHHGEVIEFYGDGSLSLYDSAVDAVQCAIEMQKDYRGSGNEINPVRIGIHLGDIVMREGSIFGNGVNIASRIESIGVAGNILCSQQVNAELKNKEHIKTKSVGKFRFKNVDDPIEVFAVDHPQVLLPSKSQLSGGKGKVVKNNYLFFLPVLLLVVSGLLYYSDVFSSKNKFSATDHKEKIAVPPFKNFTGNPELDYIGEMAAHMLTKDLIKTSAANVVAFQTTSEMQQLTGIEDTKGVNEIFAKKMGALNILNGTYSKISSDSFEFSSFIKTLNDGSVNHAFDPVYFKKESPHNGIKKLSSKVMGYWDTKGDMLLSIPNFKSYKAFLKARNYYLINDSISRAYLYEAIRIDSSFLDPYFLYLGNLFSRSEYNKMHQLLEIVSRYAPDFSSYEQNIYDIEKANIFGKNKEAYRIALRDISQFERDYYTITDYIKYALIFVNNPRSCLELFEKFELKNLPLITCSYCRESHFIATSAHIRLNQSNDAQNILDKFPESQKTRRFFSLYIKLLSRQGKLKEIENIIQEGIRLLSDEQTAFLNYIAARELLISGYEGASKSFAQKTLASHTDDHIRLGWARYFINDLEQAQAQFLQAHNVSPENLAVISQLGIIAIKRGDNDEARTRLSQLQGLVKPYQFGAVPYNMARIHYHLGEEDTALDLLQQAVDEGAKFYTNNVFDQDPDLQGLVTNARFQRITHPVAD